MSGDPPRTQQKRREHNLTTERGTVPLKLKPITLKAANEYVTSFHRHHKKTAGHKFSVSVVDDEGTIRGVGIAGRPVSRHLDAAGYSKAWRKFDGPT